MATMTPSPTAARVLPWPLAFYRSAVGKKWVMAVTGIVLLEKTGGKSDFTRPETGFA